MVDAGGSRCKEASQSVSQLFQAAKPPPPYAPGRRTARRGVSQRAATGRPAPGGGHSDSHRGPAPGTAAGRIRPVAQWQSCSNVGPKGGKAPRSSRIRVLTVCLAATPRVTAGALPARFDAGPGPRRCGGEILTFPDTRTHYSGVIPMRCFKSVQKWSLRRRLPAAHRGPRVVSLRGIFPLRVYNAPPTA